jgi:hypothetical protein
MNPKTIQIMRWITRIWAALVAAAVIFAFFANIFIEGGGSSSQFSTRDILMMVLFVLTWMGLILGWKWEAIGGGLTVGSMLAFYIFEVIFTGSFPKGGFFIVIALPGVLFLYLGLMAKE